jgi:hypothetical protein
MSHNVKKACAFARNLADIFQLHSSENESGYGLITGKILKELPVIGIKYFNQLFSAALLKGFFPAQWEVV